jgi:hypothetical protein
MSGKLKQLVTGNRLRDGVPVYFAGQDRWSPMIGEALLVPAEAADGLLADATSGPPPSPVVGPYLIEADAEAGEPFPIS